MKQKVKSEISDSAAKTLKLQTKFVIIKMPVRIETIMVCMMIVPCAYIINKFFPFIVGKSKK